MRGTGSAPRRCGWRAESTRNALVVSCVALIVCAAILQTNAAEVIPPKPPGYFNDYASVVSKDTALQLNEKLAQFERETSNQVVVAVFRKMETESDIAHYTHRIAESWKVGQADQRNGAVLFVFIDDRKMFIQVGYGLEGALPDATAFDITERRIKPRFKAGDYEGGLVTGVDLICKAISGEYKGSGKTVAERSNVGSLGSCAFLGVPCAFPLIFLFVLFLFIQSRRRGRRGYGFSGLGGPYVTGFGGSDSGGGGWSSGSSGGSSFSGFSGGGGSFGGGGAGSSW